MLGRCLFTLILSSLFVQLISAQPDPEKYKAPTPSVDLSDYNWMHPELNMLQFYDRSALVDFYKKWNNTDKKKLTVIHFGDSHCQHDVLPGQIRKRLQEKHGKGGRGLMFPTSTARTYSSVEYTTKHTGTWKAERSITMRPKLPMGIRGMSCRTENAPASLVFNFKQDVPAEYTQLKIFCKRDIRSFDITAETSGKRVPIIVDASDRKPYVTVQIPAIKDRKLTLHIVKNEAYESEFEFYGMSLENPEDKGVIVHNAGVGAARYNSLLHQVLLWEQFPHIRPDVAIVDFGTNDFLYYDKIRPELESEIKTIIDKMRKVVPDITIILTSTSDLYWKKRNCKASEPFSDMMHRIAHEKKCALYDWFWISGGQGTMLNWTRSGLAQPDMIHLTVRGYRLKGNLFADAMQNSLEWLEKNPEANEFFFKIDDLRKQKPKAVASTAKPAAVAAKKTTTQKVTTVPKASTAGRKKYVHTIKKGESLYSIGRKYNVTINQIKSWNNMYRNTIFEGKKLTIYVK